MQDGFVEYLLYFSFSYVKKIITFLEYSIFCLESAENDDTI